MTETGAEAVTVRPAAGMNTAPPRRPDRVEVRGIVCPYCGAQPGERCHNRRGPREANHIERVNRFIAQGGGRYVPYGGSPARQRKRRGPAGQGRQANATTATREDVSP